MDEKRVVVPVPFLERFGVSAGTMLLIIAQTVAIVAWLVNDHAHIIQLVDSQARQDQKIEYLDANGARIVNQRLAQVDAYMIANNRALELVQKHIDDAKTLSNAQEIEISKLQAQIDLAKQEAIRIQEQQSRIIQALDNIYNLLQEHLRMHAGNREKGSPPLNLDRRR